MNSPTTNKLFQVKRLFFDRPAVRRAVDPATRKVLGRFGALVRRTAQWSIRRHKAPSKPGQPPHGHTGLLKKFILYSFDPARQSVVIGPAKLHGTKGKDVPKALEYGGKSKIGGGGGGGGGGLGPARQIIVDARPFMQPAYDKVQHQLPALWRDSVRA